MSGGQRWKLDSYDKIDFFVSYARRELEVGSPLTVALATSASTEQQNHMQWGLYRLSLIHI